MMLHRKFDLVEWEPHNRTPHLSLNKLKNRITKCRATYFKANQIPKVTKYKILHLKHSLLTNLQDLYLVITVVKWKLTPINSLKLCLQRIYRNQLKGWNQEPTKQDRIHHSTQQKIKWHLQQETSLIIKIMWGAEVEMQVIIKLQISEAKLGQPLILKVRKIWKCLLG